MRQARDGTVERPAADPGRSESDAGDDEGSEPDGVAAAHRSELTERKLVQEAAAGSLALHATNAIGTK